MATVNKNVAAIVARHPDVKKTVNDKAQELAGRARSLLAAHRVTGETKITVTRGRVDSFVSMVGEGALSIEWGHGEYSYKGREVGASQGLYIITRAAGLSRG